MLREVCNLKCSYLREAGGMQECKLLMPSSVHVGCDKTCDFDEWIPLILINVSYVQHQLHTYIYTVYIYTVYIYIYSVFLYIQYICIYMWNH